MEEIHSIAVRVFTITRNKIRGKLKKGAKKDDDDKDECDDQGGNEEEEDPE